jgi:hypothetical protein
MVVKGKAKATKTTTERSGKQANEQKQIRLGWDLHVGGQTAFGVLI